MRTTAVPGCSEGYSVVITIHWLGTARKDLGAAASLLAAAGRVQRLGREAGLADEAGAEDPVQGFRSYLAEISR
jgi:hypothetical protein